MNIILLGDGDGQELCSAVELARCGSYIRSSCSNCLYCEPTIVSVFEVLQNQSLSGLRTQALQVFL